MLMVMKTPLPPYVKEESDRLQDCYRQWKSVAPKERTQAVLADEFGWQSQGTVSQYMTGRLELNLPTLLRFASLLGFSPAQVSPRLMSEYFPGGQPAAPDQLREPSSSYVTRKLPVIGYVQAGEFCEAVDNFQPGDADEWMEAYGPAGPNAFILKVEGLSMDPDFRPGDRVVVDPGAHWTNGDYIIAKRASDNAVTLKQIKREGDRYYLYATNPDWPKRIIELNEEWHVCGRVRRKIVEY